MFKDIFACLQIYVHTYTHMCMLTDIFAYLQTYLHTYTHICIFTYIFAYSVIDHCLIGHMRIVTHRAHFTAGSRVPVKNYNMHMRENNEKRDYYLYHLLE
jgi:hypothetical protein